MAANAEKLTDAVALRDSMTNDLMTLKENSLSDDALPSMRQNVEIVKKNITQTAKLFGFARVEGPESEPQQALVYLTTRALSHRPGVIVGVYDSVYKLRDLEEKYSADISHEQTWNFAKSCMAIVSALREEVEILISPNQ